MEERHGVGHGAREETKVHLVPRGLSVSLSIQEVEAGGLQVHGQSGQLSKTVSK